MAEAPNEIENHIENTREHLGSNLQELEQKVKSVTDWRYYFRKNPMAMIGMAFGAGVLLAATTGRKRHKWDRYMSYSPPSVSPLGPC